MGLQENEYIYMCMCVCMIMYVYVYTVKWQNFTVKKFVGNQNREH